MPRPTCRSWWGDGTRHHGHCGFNSAITLHGAALPGRLMEDRQEMLRPFVVILLAPGIDGDVRHPEDLGDVWICAAVVGQQSYPCASELAGAFLPPGDRSGQVFMFIWGEFDLNASPCQMRSFRREDAKENSKLKDFFERPLSTNRQIFWDSPDNRQDTIWTSIISCKEVLGSGDEGFETLEELAMRDFPAKMSPEHLNGIEPGTVGRQRQQHSAASRTPYNGFNVVVFMRGRVIPRHIYGLCGVLRQERLPQYRDLAAPFVRFEQDHGLSRMGIDGANAIALRGLSWRGAHHLLAFRAPHGFEGRQP